SNNLTTTFPIKMCEIYRTPSPDSPAVSACLPLVRSTDHHDSRRLLAFLHNGPADRREHSFVLCTALMRTAGLDFNE
ncbi:MAG: hypothetical protein ACT4NY_19515, partial [Pseudonocardiales bacterium]